MTNDVSDRPERLVCLYAFREGDLRFYDTLPVDIELSPEEEALRIGDRIPQGAPLSTWRELVGGDHGEVDFLGHGVISIDLSFWRDADPDSTLIGLSISEPSGALRRERSIGVTSPEDLALNASEELQASLAALRRRFREAERRYEPTGQLLQQIKLILKQIYGPSVNTPPDLSAAVEVKPGYFVLDET
jgi:hypothetical protein